METNALKHFHHQSQQQSKFNNSHLHHHQQQQHQHQHHHHQHQTANNNANSNTQQLTNQFHSNLINNTNLTNSYLNFNFTQSNQNEIDLINSNRKFFPANLTATNHHHHHHHQNNNSDNRFLSTITSNSSIISPSTIGSVQSSIVCKPIPTTAPITSIQQNATINSSHKNFANNINFQSYTNLNSSSNSISNNNSNQRNATNGINNAVVGQTASTATSATINATKIKPIAAFPLLLSSIESGQQQQQNFGSNVSNSIFKRPFQTTVQQINGSLNQRSNGPKSDKIKSKSKETTKVSGKDSSSSKSRSNGSNSATASKSISVVKSSSSSSGSNHLNHHSHHLLDQNGTIVPTNNLKNGLVNGRDGCFSRENSSSVTPVSLFKNKSNFSNFPSSDDRNRTLPYMKNVNLGSGSNDPIIGLSNSFNSTHPNPAFSTNSQTTASSFQHHLAGKNVDSTTSTLFLNHHRSNLNPSGQCNVSFNNNNHNGDQLLFQSRTGVGSTSINSDAIASIVKSTSNCANNFDNHHLLYTRRGDFIANSSSSLDRPQLDGEKNLSDGVVVSNNSNNLFVLNNRKLASFPLLATTSSSSSSITNTSAVDGQVSKSIHELNGHSNELFNANKTKPILFKIFKEKAKASKSSNGDKSTTIIGLSGKEKVNNTNSNLNSNGKTQSKSVKPVLSSSKISKRSKKTSEPNSAIKTKSRKKSSKFSSLPAASSASISSSSSSSPSTSSTILNRCKLSLSPPSQPPPPSSSSLSLSSLPSSSVSAFTKPTSTAINRLIVDGGGGGGGGLVNHKSSNHCQQEIQIEKNCTINSSSSTSSSSTFHLKQQQQNHHHYQNNATSVRIESDRNIETINSDQKCFVDPSDRSLLFDSIRPIKEIFYTEYLIDNFALQVFSNENDLMRAVDESEKLRRSRTQNGDPWSSAPDDDDDDDDGDGDDDDDDDGEENDDDHQQRKSSTLPNQNDKTKASVNDLRNRTKHCDQIVLVRRSPSPLTSSREPSPIPSTRRNSSISAASSSASSASISSDSEDDSDFSDEEEEEDDDEDDDDDDEEEEEEDEDRNDEDSQSSQESDSNPKSKNNNRRSKTLVSSKGKNSKNINRKKVVGGRQKFKQKSTRTVSNQKRKSIQSSSSTSSTTTTTTSKKNSIKKQTKSLANKKANKIIKKVRSKVSNSRASNSKENKFSANDDDSDEEDQDDDDDEDHSDDEEEEEDDDNNIEKNQSNDSDDDDDDSLDSSQDSDDVDDDDDDDEDEPRSSLKNKKSKALNKSASLKSKIKCSHRHPKNQSACSKCLSLNRKQQTNLSTRKSNLKRSITAATTANKNRLKRKSQTVKSIGVGGRLGQKGVIASTARSRKSQTSKSSPTKLVQRLNSRTKKSQKKSNKASQKDQSEDDESDDDDDDDNSDETEDDPDDDDDNDEEGEEDEDEEDSDEYEEENNGETIEDNRTIADLIKCSNRREAVRKAAARAALASVNNSRNKVNRSSNGSSTLSIGNEAGSHSTTTSSQPTSSVTSTSTTTTTATSSTTTTIATISTSSCSVSGTTLASNSAASASMNCNTNGGSSASSVRPPSMSESNQQSNNGLDSNDQNSTTKHKNYANRKISTNVGNKNVLKAKTKCVSRTKSLPSNTRNKCGRQAVQKVSKNNPKAKQQSTTAAAAAASSSSSDGSSSSSSASSSSSSSSSDSSEESESESSESVSASSSDDDVSNDGVNKADQKSKNNTQQTSASNAMKSPTVKRIGRPLGSKNKKTKAALKSAATKLANQTRNKRKKSASTAATKSNDKNLNDNLNDENDKDDDDESEENGEESSNDSASSDDENDDGGRKVSTRNEKNKPPTKSTGGKQSKRNLRSKTKNSNRSKANLKVKKIEKKNNAAGGGGKKRTVAKVQKNKQNKNKSKENDTSDEAYDYSTMDSEDHDEKSTNENDGHREEKNRERIKFNNSQQLDVQQLMTEDDDDNDEDDDVGDENESDHGGEDMKSNQNKKSSKSKSLPKKKSVKERQKKKELKVTGRKSSKSNPISIEEETDENSKDVSNNDARKKEIRSNRPSSSRDSKEKVEGKEDDDNNDDVYAFELSPSNMVQTADVSTSRTIPMLEKSKKIQSNPIVCSDPKGVVKNNNNRNRKDLSPTKSRSNDCMENYRMKNFDIKQEIKDDINDDIESLMNENEMNRTKLSNFVRSEVRSEENQDQIDVDSYENSDQHLSSNLASANSESDFIRRQKEKSHSPLKLLKQHLNKRFKTITDEKESSCVVRSSKSTSSTSGSKSSSKVSGNSCARATPSNIHREYSSKSKNALNTSSKSISHQINDESLQTTLPKTISEETTFIAAPIGPLTPQPTPSPNPFNHPIHPALHSQTNFNHLNTPPLSTTNSSANNQFLSDPNMYPYRTMNFFDHSVLKHQVPTQPVSIVSSSNPSIPIKPIVSTLPVSDNRPKERAINCCAFLHVKIAWDIYNDKKRKQQQKEQPTIALFDPVNLASNPKTIANPLLTHSNPLRIGAQPTAAATVSHIENQGPQTVPLNTTNNPTPSADPVLMSISNYTTTTIKAHDPYNGLTTLTSSQSVTTITSQYATRLPSPFASSALPPNPNLPALFPPPSLTPNPFTNELWPRKPISSTTPLYRNQLMAPTQTVAQPPADYYPSTVHPTSQALSVWASFRPSTPTTTLASNELHNYNYSSIPSSGQKRKHSEINNGKNLQRASSRDNHLHHLGNQPSSSIVYPNGDLSRSENSSENDGKKSKCNRIDNESYLHQNTDSMNSLNNTSNALKPPPPSMFPHHALHQQQSSQSFNNLSTSTPVFEHHRYYDLLNNPNVPNTPNPYPPTPPSTAFITATNANDSHPGTPKTPLWGQMNLSQPPTTPHPPPSSLVPDPFKSLQDISLRAGLAAPDRENIFSRYSLLNSSGGGASILEKLDKDQVEKLEMMKMNQNCIIGGRSSTKPIETSNSNVGKFPSNLPSSSSSTSNSAQYSQFPFLNPSLYLQPSHRLFSSNAATTDPISPQDRSTLNGLTNSSASAIGNVVSGSNVPTASSFSSNILSSATASSLTHPHHANPYLFLPPSTTNQYVGQSTMMNFMKAAAAAAAVLESNPGPSGPNNFGPIV